MDTDTNTDTGTDTDTRNPLQTKVCDKLTENFYCTPHNMYMSLFPLGVYIELVLLYQLST